MSTNKEELTVFAKIKGIGAASGLHRSGNSLYVMGDNSAYLYLYNLKNKTLKRIRALSNLQVLENIPKASKPDFEALCPYQDTLFLIGSGSAPNRELMVAYHSIQKQLTTYNLSNLYAKIKNRHGINNDNLNIEGAVFTGSHWLLFNRGNGSAGKNGIFKIIGKDLAKADKSEFTPLALLNTDNLVASFTDAVLHEKQIYFVAAVEDTRSTYDDGKILGSYIGCLDAETLHLKFTKKISNDQKFEGITLFSTRDNRLEFLLCEDRDTDILETVIYKLVL